MGVDRILEVGDPTRACGLLFFLFAMGKAFSTEHVLASIRSNG
jgi:hypothetical protein